MSSIRKLFSLKGLVNLKKASKSVTSLLSNHSEEFKGSVQALETDKVPDGLQSDPNVAGQQLEQTLPSSSTAVEAPTSSTLRSASHVSLPQPPKTTQESLKIKNKKRLSLADKRYFLYSAASSNPSSTVASPTTACPSRPVSTLISPNLKSSNLDHQISLEETEGGELAGAMPLLNENQRLTVQHDHYKRSCGSMVHPSVLPHLSKCDKILEVATGNGVWLQDLKNSSLVPATSTLHASDLFVPTQALPHGIDAFAAHDVTVPFPTEGVEALELSEPMDGLDPIQVALKKIEGSYTSTSTQRPAEGVKVGEHGSYDFINSRLLVFALSKEEWELALDNLKDLLKPGGLLHLSEVNTEAIPARPDLPHPAIDRTNRIARKVMNTFKKESNAIEKLPSLLKAHGFTSIQSTQYLIPFGQAAISAGNHSEIQAQLAAATALGAISALKKPFLAIGGEAGCQTEEEFDDFVKELEKEVMQVGMLFRFIMVAGQKPHLEK